MHVPNRFRIRGGRMGSDDSDGNHGAFTLPPLNPLSRLVLRVISSDGEGWEHVSVSTLSRCPTWDEMCHVKSIFWDDEDTVMQLHPPRSEWVNNHSFCLHLWRPTAAVIPMPPAILVGIQSLGVLR